MKAHRDSLKSSQSTTENGSSQDSWDGEIIDEKPDKSQYLIRWIDLDAQGNPYEPSWEPVKNCSEGLLTAWKQKKKLQRAASGQAEGSNSSSSRHTSSTSRTMQNDSEAHASKRTAGDASLDDSIETRPDAHRKKRRTDPDDLSFEPSQDPPTQMPARQQPARTSSDTVRGGNTNKRAGSSTSRSRSSEADASMDSDRSSSPAITKIGPPSVKKRLPTAPVKIGPPGRNVKRIDGKSKASGSGSGSSTSTPKEKDKKNALKHAREGRVHTPPGAVFRARRRIISEDEDDELEDEMEKPKTLSQAPAARRRPTPLFDPGPSSQSAPTPTPLPSTSAGAGSSKSTAPPPPKPVASTSSRPGLGVPRPVPARVADRDSISQFSPSQSQRPRTGGDGPEDISNDSSLSKTIASQVVTSPTTASVPVAKSTSTTVPNRLARPTHKRNTSIGGPSPSPNTNPSRSSQSQSYSQSSSGPVPAPNHHRPIRELPAISPSKFRKYAAEESGGGVRGDEISEFPSSGAEASGSGGGWRSNGLLESQSQSANAGRKGKGKELDPAAILGLSQEQVSAGGPSQPVGGDDSMDIDDGQGVSKGKSKAAPAADSGSSTQPTTTTQSSSSSASQSQPRPVPGKDSVDDSGIVPGTPGADNSSLPSSMTPYLPPTNSPERQQSEHQFPSLPTYGSPMSPPPPFQAPPPPIATQSSSSSQSFTIPSQSLPFHPHPPSQNPSTQPQPDADQDQDQEAGIEFLRYVLEDKNEEIARLKKLLEDKEKEKDRVEKKWSERVKRTEAKFRAKGGGEKGKEREREEDSELIRLRAENARLLAESASSRAESTAHRSALQLFSGIFTSLNGTLLQLRDRTSLALPPSIPSSSSSSAADGTRPSPTDPNSQFSAFEKLEREGGSSLLRDAGFSTTLETFRSQLASLSSTIESLPSSPPTLSNSEIASKLAQLASTQSALALSEKSLEERTQEFREAYGEASNAKDTLRALTRENARLMESSKNSIKSVQGMMEGKIHLLEEQVRMFKGREALVDEREKRCGEEVARWKDAITELAGALDDGNGKGGGGGDVVDVVGRTMNRLEELEDRWIDELADIGDSYAVPVGSPEYSELPKVVGALLEAALRPYKTAIRTLAEFLSPHDNEDDDNDEEEPDAESLVHSTINHIRLQQTSWVEALRPLGESLDISVYKYSSVTDFANEVQNTVWGMKQVEAAWEGRWNELDRLAEIGIDLPSLDDLGGIVDAVIGKFRELVMGAGAAEGAGDAAFVEAELAGDGDGFRVDEDAEPASPSPLPPDTTMLEQYIHIHPHDDDDEPEHPDHDEHPMIPLAADEHDHDPMPMPLPLEVEEPIIAPPPIPEINLNLVPLPPAATEIAEEDEEDSGPDDPDFPKAPTRGVLICGGITDDGYPCPKFFEHHKDLERHFQTHKMLDY